MRKLVFELLDKARGNPIGRHLQDIENLMSLNNFNLLREKQKPILEKLLQKATEETIFYKHLIGSKELSAFPVLDKIDIRDNFDAINIPLADSDRVQASTSGSTGTPFKIYQSRNKKLRNSADTIFFAKTAGFELGDHLLYLRFWAAYYKKPKWLAFLQNISQIEVEDLTDEYLEKLLTHLCRKTGAKGWLGYPSGFDKIVHFFEKRQWEPIDCGVRSIIAMSEPLPESTQAKMAHYFKCPVVSRYSNVENGILAQQMPGETSFRINWSSYYIEVLDLIEDIPVEPGKVGRIVVTDLYNHATPMIRYDTGDVGVMKQLGIGFPFFERIEGRKSDVLTNTTGDPINSFVFYNSLGDFPELNQVQIVQKDFHYTFRINLRNAEFNREKEFLNYFIPFLGKGAEVQIDYVEEIPNLKSGKRKMIVNLSEK